MFEKKSEIWYNVRKKSTSHTEMSSTHNASTADNRVLAEEVYDMVMGEIEPDLMLANIPLLDETYKSETPEQHESRMQRYAVAYKKFDIEIAKFMIDVDGKVRATQRQALQEKESAAKADDQNALNSIASAFA